MIRAQVLTTYPIQDASRRLRIEPLVAEMRRRGVDVNIHELFTSSAFSNKNGSIVERIGAASQLGWQLFRRLTLFSRRYDVVVVHREAFPFFTPSLERLISRRATVAVLDVDDAIYSPPTHIKDWRQALRRPEKALEYSAIFDLIFCGNEMLRDAFDGDSADVTIYPTCPPAETFELEREDSSSLSVLWTGSQSTLGSLLTVLPEVLSVCEQENLTLYVLGGANVESLPSHPRLVPARWSHEQEQKLLAKADIGLMPLPNTDWERGKSGYKAILYLCAGLRAVVSPVGINKELSEKYDSIQSSSHDDWASSLTSLVEKVRQSGPDDSSRIQARSEFDIRRNAGQAVNAILAKLNASDVMS